MGLFLLAMVSGRRLRRLVLVAGMAVVLALSFTSGCRDLTGCSGERDAAAQSDPPSIPPREAVDVNCPVFGSATEDDRAVLERHFRASLAWEVREERFGPPRGQRRYAVRLEQGKGGAFGAPAGEYRTTLNGFYSDFEAKNILQTRVLVGLGREYGFGSERGNVTRTGATAGPTPLGVERYMDQPGLESYLIVEGGAGLTLEIFEQARSTSRSFTGQVLREFCAEAGAALAARDEIQRLGYAEKLIPLDSIRHGAPLLEIADGMQGGIYLTTGWINPGEPGRARLKVVYQGPASPPGPGAPGVPEELRGREGAALSAERMDNDSLRWIGWGANPQTLFRYQSEVTVYEGNWGSRFRAQFELWFEPEQGPERKLIAASRVISGWER